MKWRLFMLPLLMLLMGTAGAYDATKAKQYEGLFAPFADANTPKALARIPAETLVNWLKAGESVVILDVRTPAERRVLGIGNPDTLSMQMNEVFQPDNLARIPTDKKVLVVCQQGLRCTLIAVALRDIGFSNVYALKGGLVALIDYLDPKVANDPLKKP